MALGASAYSELIASTMEKWTDKELVDQILTPHPTLSLFVENASSHTGRALVMNLEAAEDGDTAFTDDSGTFNTNVSGDIVGSAVYPWDDVQPLVSKVRLRHKLLEQNTGKEALVKLLKSHVEAAKKQHRKTVATALHARAGEGELTSGQFFSLDQICGDSAYDADPAGDASVAAFTVGGITATDANHFWNAHRIEHPLDDATYGTGNIRKVFRDVRNELAVANSANSAVTHIVCGRDIFEEYEDAFDDKVRYILKKGDEGQGQFRAIWDGDIEVRLDPDAPAKRAYFLDINSLELGYLNGNWMKVHPAQTITGTLDFVTPIASIIQVGTKERRANAVLLRPSTAGGTA